MSTATMLAVRSLRSVAAHARVAPRRFAHTSGAAGRKSSSLLATVGAVGAVGSYVAYKTYKGSKWNIELQDLAEAVGVQKVFAASAKYPPSQASVFSQTKEHALYLWIHLSPKADAKKCAKVVADIQGHADVVSPADLRDEDNEIIAGVGFGPDFYSKVGPAPAHQNYKYRDRKGPLGAMPAGGGDIFIHAKSNNVSKLFELGQRVLGNLPPGSVAKFEDVYSFVYRNGRDLSGFIDGTENPADEDDRQAVAVEPETGGSYVITQKWIHRLDVIGSEKPTNLEKFVGRSREDSVELKGKPISSHVARMTGGTGLDQAKPFQIVRQSMPYGNLHDKAGLFFIAYAASPNNFNYMLDRMVGVDADGHSDDIMRLSECVASTYWYFPGLNELKKIK